MCGYCIEYSAITMEPDEAEALAPYYGTTIATLYRPGGHIYRDIAVQAFDQEPDNYVREAIALILWLRDADTLLIKQLRSSKLNVIPVTIDLDQPNDEQQVLTWYHLSGERVLWRAAIESQKKAPEDVEITLSCIAVWAGFHHHRQTQAWRKSVTQLAEPRPIPAKLGWDMRLWLRREAQLALWLSGHSDVAKHQDREETFQPVMTWMAIQES